MSTILFERLGGFDGITALVDDAVQAHMNNPAICNRFLPYLQKPEQLASIRKHTIDFFSAGSGGPVTYHGRDMPTAHRGMHITDDEYNHAVNDILEVMAKHKIDETSQREVTSILWSLKNTIVAQ